MNNDELQELMYLSLYDELSEEDRKRLDAFLKKHPEKKKELTDLKKFRSFMTEHTSENTVDALLDTARTQLRAALHKEHSRFSGMKAMINFFGDLLEPKFAFTGVGALSLGVLIGYCSFNGVSDGALMVQPVSNNASVQNSTRIANVRFIDSDAADGDVEFEFDAFAPMRVKGKVDDPEIQKILSHALLSEANDGVRLSTVSTIARQVENNSITDPSVRAALITTLKSDGNPGVRMEALRVLQRCTFGNDIRDAFLHVLMHDDNSGLRVAAINSLGMAKLDGNRFDRSTVDSLNKQIQNEQNHYIRNRAVSLVKEIYQ